MTGTERISDTDKLRVIKKVVAADAGTLRLVCLDGTAATLDLSDMLRSKAFAALRDANAFVQVTVGEWGHSFGWPCGAEMGADMLWLETLTATGHGDARAFLEWRLRYGLSLSKAADAHQH